MLPNQKHESERPHNVRGTVLIGSKGSHEMSGLLAGAAAVMLVGCSGTPEENLNELQEATTYQNNGNRTTFPWNTVVSYPLSTIGSLNVGCSGTLIAPNKVLSAAHCLGDIAPSSLTFTPHGSTTSATATRIVQGRSPADAQIYGDWAIITLNQSFAANGVMAMTEQDSPPIQINNAGYSGDLAPLTLGVHFGCWIRIDDINGIGNECDLQGGASGGPLYTWSGAGTAKVHAVNSSHSGETNVAWSVANTNRAAGAR